MRQDLKEKIKRVIEIVAGENSDESNKNDESLLSCFDFLSEFHKTDFGLFSLYFTTFLNDESAGHNKGTDFYDGLMEKFERLSQKDAFSPYKELLEDMHNICLVERSRMDILYQHEQSIQRLQSDLETSATKVADLNNKIKKTKDRLGNVKRDFVAILGIFAAIFMAFDSGLKINLAVFDKKGLDDLIALCLFMFASFFTLILLHSLYRFVKNIANNNQDANKTDSWEYGISIFLLFLLAFVIVYKSFNANSSSSQANHQIPCCDTTAPCLNYLAKVCNNH
ncbi:hypothetical protein [Helicobacter cetorum]|uniref:Uncharacterized protein n=1 Tax=Helicobacter cetorum (strain ATCC BAA-540 / CCUG 52418 / MIT 99-5656) TaxID=1163745 RepID=I0EQB1_HELCM|nr:hypothetical protein [Helicobacter cetorum]AFI05130.1 hypothetical protein HCD_00490 [Helicobacter cetorum MIT 99-5656]